MNRRPSLLMTALMLIFLSAVSFAAGAATQSGPVTNTQFSNEEVYKYLNPFIDALAIIREKYVDVDKTDPKDLIYGAIRGMVNTLDPFSQFMTPEEYKQMQTETSGEFGGLGIEISMKEDHLTVISPIEGTPAERAGIKSGDMIVKIGKLETDGMNINDAVKLLRGKVGTPVTITILRPGLTEPFNVTLIRENIKIDSIHSLMLPNDIGYVRITEFMDHTSDDLIKAVQDLEHQHKLKGLVIDLRDNPGGLLDEAAGVADYFGQQGKMIVSTKGRSSFQTQEFRVDDSEKFDPNKPVVVMVNSGSASGAEIVAGAIRDWHRGILIGEKTFGKGTVQTILPLQDSGGAALRLTMAHYYTPSGVCINGIGIEPNLNLQEPELTESTVKVYTQEIPIKFADMLFKKKIPVTKNIELSNKIMDQFYAYALKHVKKIDKNELLKNDEDLRNSICEELVSDKFGDKAARAYAVLHDPQVAVAEEIIEDGGKISAELRKKYPKIKDTTIAGDKQLTEERARMESDDQ